MKKSNLFSMQVSLGSYDDFVQGIISRAEQRDSDYACVANVHMLMETYSSPSFSKAVSNAAIITPDGKPLTWALRLIHGIRQPRVAGMDLLPDLLKSAEDRGIAVYFYGGTNHLLSQTEGYLRQHYSALRIAGMHAPPFRALTIDEEQMVVDTINRSGAQLVLVILGCPKQERWMASMKERVQCFMIGLGGALPVLVGNQKRAPRWMQSSGLEWAYRLMQEPGRLLKRYAVTNTQFLYLLIRAYLHKRIFQRTFPSPYN